MNRKIKISVFFLFSLYMLSMMFITPVVSFTSDSYSQEIGEIHIWERKVDDSNETLEGMQTRATITDTNVTKIVTLSMGLRPTSTAWWCDTLWGIIETKLTDGGWSLQWYDIIATYNSTRGVLFRDLFIPHNESAVNQSVNEWFNFLLPGGDYKWTSGAHGYDGDAVMHNGSADGTTIGSVKYVLSFNEDGLKQTEQIYYGSAQGWVLSFEEEYKWMQNQKQVPGLLLGDIFLLIAIVCIVYFLISRRKLELNMI